MPYWSAKTDTLVPCLILRRISSFISLAIGLNMGTNSTSSVKNLCSFYRVPIINRAGKKLDPKQKEILEQAKDELRKLFGKPTA